MCLNLLKLKLENGNRLEKPEKCPIEIYNIMFKCWLTNKNVRPTMSQLVNEFENVSLIISKLLLA